MRDQQPKELRHGPGRPSLFLLGIALLFVACDSPKEPQALFELASVPERARWESETPRIDFGTASAHPHLRGGFGVDQPLANGDHRVTSRGDSSSVSFFLSQPRALTLQLDWESTGPGFPVQVAVNDRAPRSMAAPGTRGQRSLRIPAADLQSGTNTLEFLYPTGSAGTPRVHFYALDLVDAFHTLPRPETPSRSRKDDIAIPFRSQVEFAIYAHDGSVLELDGVRAVPQESSGLLEIRYRDAQGQAGMIARLPTGSTGGRFPLPVTGGPLRISFSAAPAGEGTAAGEVVAEKPVIRNPNSSPAAEAEATKQTPPNILLYISDTLRPDHLGAYGHTRPVSPAIDRLAEDGFTFDRAYAQSSWTVPSMTSLLTGLGPRRHGVTDIPLALPHQAITLPELLQASGYETAAFVANPYMSPTFGMDQGFDVFQEERNRRRLPRETHADHEQQPPLHAPTDTIHESALEWLSRRTGESPFFLYVHAMDPHAPYRPPKAFRERFAGHVKPSDPAAQASIEELARGDVSAETVEQLKALYDAEIAANDQAFGTLVEDLKKRGLYEDTLIIFASDHGEAFWERKRLGHGHTLHNEGIDIPLIIKPPGGSAGGSHRVNAPATQVDLVPTILEAANLPLPHDLDGQSLAPLLKSQARGPQFSGRPIFSHLFFGAMMESESVIEGRWKLIRFRTPEGTWQTPLLYDLRNDPDEMANIANDRPRIRERLTSRLEARNRLAPEWSSLPVETDSLLLQQLDALGYHR